MVEDFDVTGSRYDDVVEHFRKIFRAKCEPRRSLSPPTKMSRASVFARPAANRPIVIPRANMMPLIWTTSSSPFLGLPISASIHPR